MTTRFKNPLLQAAYERALVNPPLRDGKPYRGNSTATAFSDGVRGRRTGYHSPIGSIGSALYSEFKTFCETYGDEE